MFWFLPSSPSSWGLSNLSTDCRRGASMGTRLLSHRCQKWRRITSMLLDKFKRRDRTLWQGPARVDWSCTRWLNNSLQREKPERFSCLIPCIPIRTHDIDDDYFAIWLLPFLVWGTVC